MLLPLVLLVILVVAYSQYCRSQLKLQTLKILVEVEDKITHNLNQMFGRSSTSKVKYLKTLIQVLETQLQVKAALQLLVVLVILLPPVLLLI